MKLFIKPTTVSYSSTTARVILTSEGDKELVKVYLPNYCKLVKGIESNIVPTWRSEGVLNERLTTAIAKVFDGKARAWEQAKDHAPAPQLEKLLTMLGDKPFSLSYEGEVVTLQPTVGTDMPERSKLNNVIKALIESLGFNRIKDIRVIGVLDHPEESNKPDCLAQLEQATDIVNGVFADTALDDAIVTMSDVGGTISLPNFADIVIDASVEETVTITLSFKHQRHYASIDVRKSHEITQAIVAVIRHILGDNSFATKAAVKLEVVLMKQNERKTTGAQASILDVTHKPDVSFKLPVTPVLYNYTNIVIDIDGARVVPHSQKIRLQDSQYEGDPVIGVILDFSHPTAGLHDLRAVRNKNPNIPVYILWNSDKGVELELYND